MFFGTCLEVQAGTGLRCPASEKACRGLRAGESDEQSEPDRPKSVDARLPCVSCLSGDCLLVSEIELECSLGRERLRSPRDLLEEDSLLSGAAGFRL